MTGPSEVELARVRRATGDAIYYAIHHGLPLTLLNSYYHQRARWPDLELVVARWNWPPCAQL